MLAAQKPAAPSTARPPREGWAKSPTAKRKPSPKVAGTFAALRSHDLGPLAVGEGRQPLLDVRGDQGDQDPDHEQHPGDRGRDDRQLDRVFTVQHAGPQQDPEDDQGDRVEGVVQGDEGDHPPSDVAARHPGFAQGPVGDGDAPGTAGGEEQRRRHPGHVDLVGLTPAQAQGIAADDRLEEGYVGRVSEDVEADRDSDPNRLGIPQLAHRPAQPDQLGEEEVDADEQHQDQHERLQKPPRRQQRHLDGPVVPVRRVLMRHERKTTRSRSSPSAEPLR